MSIPDRLEVSIPSRGPDAPLVGHHAVVTPTAYLRSLVVEVKAGALVSARAEFQMDDGESEFVDYEVGGNFDLILRRVVER